MTPLDIWAELGIPFSSDVAAIRRAYVAKLRTIDIEADPAAFMALRQAFERAIQVAESRVSETEMEPEPEIIIEDDYDNFDGYDEDDIQDFAPLPDQRVPVEWFQNQRSLNDWRDFLSRMITAYGIWVTWKLFNQALAKGDIALADQTPLAKFLMTEAVKDETLPRAAFMTMVKTLGLEDALFRFDDWQDLSTDIKKRIDAYHWLDALKATAQRRPRGLDRYPVLAARIFLYPGTWLPRIPAMFAAVDKILGEYHGHAAWLRNDVNTAWLQRLETSLHRIKQLQARNGKIFLYGVLAFFGLDILYIVVKNLLAYLN